MNASINHEHHYTQALGANLSKIPWDVIVIGSGLGGMTTANLVVRGGKKCLLLERHDTLGGFTHVFKRKKFEWDVGLHYVGQMQSSRSILRKIFDYLTEEKLMWTDMGEIYDQVQFPSVEFNFRKGSERLQADLIQRFPAEQDGITRYFKLVASAAGSGPWFFGEKTMPLGLSKILGWLLRYRFQKWARRTTTDVLEKLTSNPHLRAILCTQCGDYGMPPDESSFAIHAAVVQHYLAGASYPDGGSSQIGKTVLDAFYKFGGVAATSASVANIWFEKGKVRGVQMSDGTQISATDVVSTCGVHNTLQKLIPSEDLRRKFDPHGTAKALPPSMSHACLYLGLDQTDEELKLPQHNIWSYDSLDFARGLEKIESDLQAPFPLVYLSFPSGRNARRMEINQGRATIQAIVPLPFHHLKRWRETRWRKRGEEYEQFKAELSDRLLAHVEKCVPQIKGHVAFREVSTPLSTLHFANYQHGEIYGLAHGPARFRCDVLRPRTRIPHLFLSGQDIVTVGIGGALYSGVLTATCILKKSVILRILFKLGLGGRAIQDFKLEAT